MLENKEEYSYDIIVQGIAKCFGGLLSFSAVFVITYLFDESSIGEYNILLSTLNIVTSVSSLWLTQSILRYYDREKEFVLLASIIIILFSLTVFFIINICIDVSTSIWPYLYIVFLLCYNVLDAIFRRKRRLLYYLVLEFLVNLGKIVPMVFIALYTRNYNAIFASQVFIFIIYSTILISCNLKVIKLNINLINTELFNQYLKYGIPLLGLSISSWLLSQSDRYIIQYYFSDFEVGIYSVVYSLAHSIYMLFSLIIVNAFHPIIMKSWDVDCKKTITIVSKTLDYYLMLMIPILYYGCKKSVNLLALFNGESYVEHSSIFIWTSFGIFVYGLSLLYHKYFELIESTSTIFLYNILVASINILLNIHLIPIFGFEIAAFTTFISYFIYIIMVRMSTYKKFRIEINKMILSKVLLSIIIFDILDNTFVDTQNFITFCVEGVMYVIYTLVFYQTFKIVDFFGFVKNKTR